MALANRFDFQFYAQGKHGGLQYYPFSGIENGVKISSTSAAGTTVTLSVSEGQAYLDSELVDVPALSGLTFEAPSVLTTVGNDYEFGVYLNPTRRTPAVMELPASAEEGDVVVKVYDNNDYTQLVDEFLQFKSGAWVPYVAIQAPPTFHHNNMPLHDVLNDVTADNFSTTPELVIYHSTSTPAYVYSQAKAFFRKSGSVKIADVSVIAGATPAVTIKPWQMDKKTGI